MTFNDLISTSIATLSQQHPDTAHVEVHQLIKFFFNKTQAELLICLNEQIDNHHQLDQFNSGFNNRLQGKPLDLILGTTQFYKHTYFVEKGVLIPRPETEIVLQYAIEEISKHFKNNTFTCLELGFGTGILSIELAYHYPEARILAWDISKKAFECAQKNAQYHAIKNTTFFNKDFFKSNWTEYIEKNQPFVFISNPPYIPTKDIQTLDHSVLNYDPITALDGGVDGLDYYTKLFELMKTFNVLMIFEIGHNQADNLNKILSYYKEFKWQFKSDLAKHNRYLMINNFHR